MGCLKKKSVECTELQEFAKIDTFIIVFYYQFLSESLYKTILIVKIENKRIPFFFRGKKYVNISVHFLFRKGIQFF